MPAAEVALTALLRRDRAIILASLLGIALLAWAYLFWFAAAMRMEMPATAMNMAGMAQEMAPAFTAWSVSHALVMFAMWAIMMVGMMTPSVTPVILLYARTALGAQAKGKPFAAASWFAAGYLAAWLAFALAATAGQWALEWAALLTPMMKSANRIFGGLLLLAAGAYQWTPIKHSCLNHCRAPLQFIQAHGGFRPGHAASLKLGFLHGAYCVGCCWALMTLLFAGGVMNLLWIAALMVLVLLEKITPWGLTVARAAGLLAAVGGAWMMMGH
jgi:predicted metal-binding membrane protein